MSSTNFNAGIAADNKISTRVLKPPGGDHSNIFAPPEELLHQPRLKNFQQDSSLMSQIMGKKYEEPSARIQSINNTKIQQDSALMSEVIGKEHEDLAVKKQTFNTKTVQVNSSLMDEIMGKKNEYSDAGKQINRDIKRDDIECNKIEAPAAGKQTNSGKAHQQDSSLMGEIMGKNSEFSDSRKPINQNVESKQLKAPAAGKQMNSGKAFQQDSSLMDEIMGKIPRTPKEAFESSRGKAPPDSFSKGMW